MYIVHTSIGLLRQCYIRQVVSSGALKIRLRKGPYYFEFLGNQLSTRYRKFTAVSLWSIF